MNDRELLELAAKAAGIDVHGVMRADWLNGHSTYWNPLKDDGDALRLAVKLDISVFGSFPFNAVAAFDGRRIIETKQADDPMPATRRAIVRAAAAIAEKS